MKAITLRKIPEDVARLIQREASESGLSLNKTVIRLLRERIETENGGPLVHHDLDHLAGSWSPQEAAEFERALTEMRSIDAELWS
jgi:hypothetical protein